MTVVKLSKNGFNLKGHSTADAEDEIGKLVCASISSAAYLTVNTITDVIGDKAEIDLDDGKMVLRLCSVSKESANLLKGFKLHLLQLSEQYPNCIKVISEV